MANVTNLKVGSKGSDVKKMQQALINAGYDVGKTGADGSFGKNTLAAVRKYQKDNGLAVDGIAGKNTLGSLYGAGTTKVTGTNNGGATKKDTNAGKTQKPAAAAPKAAPADAAPAETATPVTSPGGVTYGDFYYDPFAGYDDPVVKQALDLLNQNRAEKPGAWIDPYLDQYMGYLNQYENRDPFSYDFNSDALYQQYKDQYIQQGQLAMMDTMGQAAAMTGGYGNSYAQTVGQQAYNQSLGQLNEIMPELYGMAYDRYQQEGQDMLNKYSLYKGLSDQSYSMYQNELDNWYQEDARLTDNLNTLYGQAYDNYLLGYNTALNEYNTTRNENFTAEQNANNQKFTASENAKDRKATEKANAKSDLIKLITSTGYKPKDDELKDAGMTRDQANSYATAYTESQTPKTPNYTVLDFETTQKWEKKFEGATSITDIEKYADQMEDSGVDPEIVADWYEWYVGKFKDKEPEPQNKPPVNVGGGSGTAHYVMEVR